MHKCSNRERGGGQGTFQIFPCVHGEVMLGLRSWILEVGSCTHKSPVAQRNNFVGWFCKIQSCLRWDSFCPRLSPRCGAVVLGGCFKADGFLHKTQDYFPVMQLLLRLNPARDRRFFLISILRKDHWSSGLSFSSSQGIKAHQGASV